MKAIKIALVDDHQLFREGIKSIFDKTPEIVLLFEASSGLDLFDNLKNNIPDVILLDLEMEGMNGIDATIKLNEEYPEIKIIILSMHKEARMVSYLMEIGASGYLLKDTKAKELKNAIEKVHHFNYYFNSEISAALLKRLRENDRTVPDISNPTDLTRREIDVLKLIAKELTTAEIAHELNLGVRTIEGYRKNMLSKMGAKNTAGLIIKAIQQELISV